METRKILTILVLALCLMVCSAKVSEAVEMGTVFTYQGWLMDDKKPADGLYDFKFELYDDPNTGVQQGSTIDINDLDVVDGHFTVGLDFGSSVFDGNACWLETAVRQGASNDPCDFVTLSPRQEFTPTPYAVYAAKAGAIPGGTANYIPKFLQANKLGNSVIYESSGNIGIGTTSPATKLDVNDTIKATAFVGDGSGLTNLPVAGIPTGVIVMWSGSIASIPSGWALCDGQVHDGKLTPDLRDRFIVGAGDQYAVRDTGGEKTHRLTINEMPSHTHSGGVISHHGASPGDDGAIMTLSTTGSSGGDQPHENRPPYYALAFIMKL